MKAVDQSAWVALVVKLPLWSWAQLTTSGSWGQAPSQAHCSAGSLLEIPYLSLRLSPCSFYLSQIKKEIFKTHGLQFYLQNIICYFMFYLQRILRPPKSMLSKTLHKFWEFFSLLVYLNDIFFQILLILPRYILLWLLLPISPRTQLSLATEYIGIYVRKALFYL